MTTAPEHNPVFVLFLAILLVFVGCTSPEYSEPQVSDKLNERTGHSLGEQKDPGTLALPPGVSLNTPLTDEDAVAIALWNNAAFLELLSELGIARADFIQAGQLSNPTFLALLPAGPKQLEFTAKFPLEALWLRPARMEASNLNAEQIAERLVQGGLDLVRDVKLACADLRLATGTAKVKKDAASLRKKITSLADSRFRAGDISEVELSTARIDALIAEQEWQRAEAEITLGQLRLQALMGLGQRAAHFKLTESSPFSFHSIDRGIDELLKDALANRPDLRAAELAIEAAGKRAKLAEREIYSLTGIIDANDTGNDFEIGPGLELPIPVFNQNEGGKAIADATLVTALRHYITVRDQITLEVNQSYARWVQARDAAEAWETRLLPELETSLQLAQLGVQSGDLPPLQSLETEYKLNTALLNQRVALADWQRAAAELERAIGHRLDLNPSAAKTLSNSQP